MAFVDAAAGAVGHVAGQLLKNVYNCRVVGSAGSQQKVSCSDETCCAAHESTLGMLPKRSMLLCRLSL